jgi:ADP-heptose:LPS heptosyltransferase
LPLVVVGSEGEAELAAGMGKSLAGRCSVPVMSAVLSRAALLVGNNSAPMHIADAVGTPMVILFSGTDLHEQWRPRDVPARLLTRPAACAPCHGLQCPYSMECLDIPPEEVVEEAMALLC